MPQVEQQDSRETSRTSVRYKLDTVCERAILCIVLAILVVGPLAMGAVVGEWPVGDFGFLAIQALTILALAFWVARFYIQRPFRLFWPPMCWMVLAFAAYAIVRCQRVVIEYPAQQLLVRVIVYAALFFIVLHNLNRRESATAVGLTLIVLGFVLSGVALFQFTTHYPKVWFYVKPDGYIKRGSGTFFNPDNLAGFLSMVAPIGLAFTLMGRFSPTVKVLLGYCTVAMLVGIGTTLSRGGILAAGCALTVFCVVLLYHRDYWKRALVMLVVLIGFGLYFSREMTVIQRRFASTFWPDGTLYDNRFYYWHGAIEIFKRHVWWGAGPGHYPFEFPQFRSIYSQTNMFYAHNDYLNTLCEWGAVGLGIVVLALVVMYWGVIRTWPYVRKTANEMGASNSTKAAFVAGAAFGLLAVLLHTIVDFDMQIPANAVTAITLMALLTAQRRFATERYWKNPGKIGKVILFAAAIGTFAYLANREFHNGREAYWLARGASLKSQWQKESTALKDAQKTGASDAIAAGGASLKKIWEGELAALTNAYFAEPSNYQTCYELGDYYRILSWQGNPDYKSQAYRALTWYGRSMAANPLYACTPMRYGMCLDWLDRTNEATPYFQLADKLDPNSYFIAAYEGWHRANLSDYEGARKWFERSLSIVPDGPDAIAKGYLDMVNRRIADSQKKPVIKH